MLRGLPTESVAGEFSIGVEEGIMVGVRVGCLMGFSAGSIVSVSVRRCVVIAIAVKVGSVRQSFHDW